VAKDRAEPGRASGAGGVLDAGVHEPVIDACGERRTSARALHAYLHWRNTNARHPGVLAARACPRPQREGHPLGRTPSPRRSLTNPANPQGRQLSFRSLDLGGDSPRTVQGLRVRGVHL
jgi:hypothetical protein